MYIVNERLKRDPTRTGLLRRAMGENGTRRWRELSRAIRVSIVDNDAFGIQAEHRDTLRTQAAPIPAGRYHFKTSQAKILGFLTWLQEEERRGILERTTLPHGDEARWSDLYIDSAYKRGIRDTRARLRRRGLASTLPGAPGPSDVMLEFASPIHAERLLNLYTRTFAELETVAAIQNQRLRRTFEDGLSRELTRGLAEGRSPISIARSIARSLGDDIEKVGVHRVRMIARTEILRAYHDASIQEMEETERLTGLSLQVDIVLAADPCAICIDLEAGGPYTVDEARNLLPAHPNCRCATVAVPIPAEEKRERRAA